MILPSKHIPLNSSLIGIGGYALDILSSNALSLDECHKLLLKKYGKKINCSLNQMVKVIALLYIMGAVDINKNGEVFNVHSFAKSK